MHKEIEKHRKALTALCQHHGEVRLELLGSVAHGADFDSAERDADFLIDGLQAFDQFLGFSEASAVRNPYIRATIGRSKELIYAA